MLNSRVRAAIFAALVHLSATVLVALISSALVFLVWYPSPFHELIGGRELFLLLVTVDVVCGPLLTLVVFNPEKSRAELIRDVSFVVVLQFGALFYGMWTVMQARPVFVAFEGDRFRVVRKVDIDVEMMSSAPEGLRTLSLLGPKQLGVRLATPTDPDYLSSIKAALQGDHPAFRPLRWVPYDQQRQAVIASAQPISVLREKNEDSQKVVDNFLSNAGLTADKVGYLPLIAGGNGDWSVVIDRESAEIISYLRLDGWPIVAN